jgi:maltose O-acetyltransferase
MMRVLRSLRVAFVRDLLLNVISSSWVCPRRTRGRLLRLAGHDVSRSARIAPRSFYGATTGLFIGERAFVNRECFFDLSAPIVVGKDVAIGFRTAFITSSHELGPESRRAGKVIASGISVGDGCWVGANVKICPGVQIPAGSVIGAGSTVTSTLHASGFYAGSPARLIRLLG